MTETPADQAKLAQAAKVLNPYGKRTSKPEPGQTWRVRVPKSEKLDGQHVALDGVVVINDFELAKNFYAVVVACRRRYIHNAEMLYLVKGRQTREICRGVDCGCLYVANHVSTCHYRLGVLSHEETDCPHGTDDALDCEHCFPCTCTESREAAA